MTGLLSRRPAPGSTLVYDGDCGFCTRCVRLLERLRLADATVVPWQAADLPALGLTQEQCEHELQWVGPTGTRSGGAQAVARLLLASGPPWVLAGLLLRVPPLSWLAAGVYRLVADRRGSLPGGTPACALPADQRPGAG